MSQPFVSVLMGSDSDLPIMEASFEILRKFEIPFEVKVTSAHRTPKATHDFVTDADISNHDNKHYGHPRYLRRKIYFRALWPNTFESEHLPCTQLQIFGRFLGPRESPALPRQAGQYRYSYHSRMLL